MNILKHVDNLRDLTVCHGNYRVIAGESGVTVHWLQKFAQGAIKNPCVKNVAKLEKFFTSHERHTD